MILEISNYNIVLKCISPVWSSYILHSNMFNYNVVLKCISSVWSSYILHSNRLNLIGKKMGMEVSSFSLTSTLN